MADQVLVPRPIRSDVKLKVDCDGLGLDAQRLYAIQQVANRHGLVAQCGGAKETVLEVDARRSALLQDTIANAPQAMGQYGPITNGDGSPKIVLNRGDMTAITRAIAIQYRNDAQATGLLGELAPLVGPVGVVLTDVPKVR